MAQLLEIKLPFHLEGLQVGDTLSVSEVGVERAKVEAVDCVRRLVTLHDEVMGIMTFKVAQ